ncbi:uncharacterized protein LOC116775960 [Danaus plexippus]|uniref:uncharacterized protein LOC116775960 n=1 Tax=Danaus plexippus TaxID=13037 RepID=UPI002AB28F98|nr:uncharacterized protein LOC116775960 [Danaus plexippus]
MDEESEARPSPDNFLDYLPWACKQLQMQCEIAITKIYQNEYVSVATAEKSKRIKSKIKLTASRYDVNSDQYRDDVSEAGLQPIVVDNKVIRISAVYDSFDNLVEIRFERNLNIPRMVLKVIALIIRFQSFISKVTIRGGMDKYTVYEINKMMTSSNLTEICFDGAFLKEANYDILLENSTSIRSLSLSRCKIGDDVIKKISAKLTFPSPASLTLNILNISTNRLTDVGAKYIAEALRTNRRLCYLNVSGNRITDDGLGYILDSLVEFPLSCDELISARARHMLYLKQKNVLIERMIDEIKAGEFDKRAARRKSTRVPAIRRGKLEKESSLKSLADAKSLANMDIFYYDKAVSVVENTLGEFSDPYSAGNTIERYGTVYCMGCNSLCYLNVAYNNLSYLSVKKILSVLLHQKLVDRKPRGLINLCIEGNSLPASCRELVQVDDLLEAGLVAHSRRYSNTSKKRPQSKTTPR